jgi:succinate dehydrogenase flavin-adding protein (antitoxin of CptAB toxin-antitoxin module)
MVNYLCWTGIKEAEPLLEHFSPTLIKGEELDENRPFKRRSDSDLISLSYQIFETAEKHLNEDQILSSIQKWTKEDRSGFLSKCWKTWGHPW